MIYISCLFWVGNLFFFFYWNTPCDPLSASSKKRCEMNSAPHIEVYPENNIPLMQAFDVNAGAFIEPVNSGQHSACYLAMTFHRLNVYALHLASSSSLLFFLLMKGCTIWTRALRNGGWAYTAHAMIGRGFAVEWDTVLGLMVKEGGDGKYSWWLKFSAILCLQMTMDSAIISRDWFSTTITNAVTR